MKWWKAAIAFLVAFLIQNTFLNLIAIKGIAPNLLLCLVVVFSFFYAKESYGIIGGAIIGLIYDICYSQTLGVTAIPLVFAGLTTIFMSRYANLENTVSFLIASVSAFLVYFLGNWALTAISLGGIGILYAFFHSVFPMIFTILVSLIVYKIMVKKVIKYHKDRYFLG